MKKIGIRVLLALILSVVMVIGVVGVAEAKGPPVREFTVELSQYVQSSGAHAGDTHLRAQVDWEGYRAFGYHYEFYKYESGVYVLKGEYSTPLSYVTGPRSVAFSFYGTDHNVSPGEEWKVEVTLLKKNGSESKRPKMISDIYTIS